VRGAWGWDGAVEAALQDPTPQAPPILNPTPHRSVMRYMQCMAHRGGHTVIASIHQPRAAIWAMFDTVSGGGLLLLVGWVG